MIIIHQYITYMLLILTLRHNAMNMNVGSQGQQLPCELHFRQVKRSFLLFKKMETFILFINIQILPCKEMSIKKFYIEAILPRVFFVSDVHNIRLYLLCSFMYMHHA